MKRFRLSPTAQRDLDDIERRIAADNVAAAIRVVDKILSAIRSLARNPGIRHRREDLGDKRNRFFPVYSYLIVYRTDLKPVQVVRILHAARDIKSILDMESAN